METNFKTYTGTKTIKAMAMGANEAKNLYNANITEETVRANIGNNGYLVEYPDGYRSWSPKKVFEEAYSLSETHIDRMKNELADLNDKICKASTALYGANSPLRKSEPLWASLREQLNTMFSYADVLYTRICQAECWEDNQRKEATNGTVD